MTLKGRCPLHYVLTLDNANDYSIFRGLPGTAWKARFGKMEYSTRGKRFQTETVAV